MRNTNKDRTFFSEEKVSLNNVTDRLTGISFATVLVREYKRNSGDHPCVSSGPPISLGWDVENECIYFIDMYEQAPAWFVALGVNSVSLNQ